jgi:hypothetical protein
MALSYFPARAVSYDRRREFRAWVDCDDRHGSNFCLVRCNAHKRVQALPTMPLYGVSTVDAPLQERGKSRKKTKTRFLRDRKPLEVDILLSRAYVDLKRAAMPFYFCELNFMDHRWPRVMAI